MRFVINVIASAAKQSPTPERRLPRSHRTLARNDNPVQDHLAQDKIAVLGTIILKCKTFILRWILV
jgi:hypothetical protein